MAIDKLSDAQREALDALADLRPHFALTGGGALVAVHLGQIIHSEIPTQ